MSWNQYQNNTQSNLPYVDNIYNPASVPTTPAQSQQSYWPTPSLESRLSRTPKHKQASNSVEPSRANLKETVGTQTKGLGLYVNTATPQKTTKTSRKPASKKYTPARQAPQRTVSSPAIYHTPDSAASQRVPKSLDELYTPPLSAQQFRVTQTEITTIPANMAQRRMSSQGQRPVMGPPETPSRGMIPQSPGLFPNIQFSPDLFSQQMMEAQAMPVYPQQRLFWDPSTATPLQSTPQNFHTPNGFPDDFNTSFNSNSTIVQPNFTATPSSMPYDLPPVSESMDTSFMDGSVFPGPFQASPRPPPPPPENPTHFLSSPARRFGGDAQHNPSTSWRAVPELPAYHHQIQDSKREKEMIARGRRKSRVSKRPNDDDMVMSSVRRALSPSKSIRPSLARSATYSGLQIGARRSSSTLDNISLDSSASSRSMRQGRSSPLKQIRDGNRRPSGSAKLRRVSSVTLTIDQHGVARTTMKPVPEQSDIPMNDDDDDLTDQLSSDDEFDSRILHSFSGETSSPHDALPNLSTGDARDELRSHAYLTLGVDRVARVSKTIQPLDPRLGPSDPASTIRRARPDTTINTNTEAIGPVSAQQALRQMMQERSRSASSHASTSSMQFHSSPPLQAGQLPGFNGSPTTVTDPDLATPSTDNDSLGSSGATRCVCNSISPDGNIMIQCDSCSKWLHAKCVGLTNRNIPDIYVCIFCEQTPVRTGGGTIRARYGLMHAQMAASQSPLAHKSSRSRLR